MECIIDLHTHTTASDGSLSPEELIVHALEEGVCAIAVTDHDTVKGIRAAYEKGTELGLEVIPGVEISTGDNPEIHMLGYFNPGRYREIENVLSYLQKKREERNPRIVDKLRHLGKDITMEDVRAESEGDVIGRLHIAKALCTKGYTANISEAFDIYLAEGRPAFVRRTKLTVEDGIRVIKKAGGIPVLAHPKYLGKTYEEIGGLLDELKKAGLEGLEVFYSDNTCEENGMYKELALKKGLVITGGSDFHGENKPGIRIGRGRDNLSIGYLLLEELKMRLSI